MLSARVRFRRTFVPPFLLLYYLKLLSAIQKLALLLLVSCCLFERVQERRFQDLIFHLLSFFRLVLRMKPVSPLSLRCECLLAGIRLSPLLTKYISLLLLSQLQEPTTLSIEAQKQHSQPLSGFERFTDTVATDQYHRMASQGHLGGKPRIYCLRLLIFQHY